MTAELVELLTIDQEHELAECEQIIERDGAAFMRVGNALQRIRDGRLYRATHGNDFAGYCRDRWDLSDAYANRMIQGAHVATIITPIGVKINEGQARELTELVGDPEALRDVWTETITSTDGKPTAAAIRAVIEARRGPAPKPEPKKANRRSLPEVAESAFYDLRKIAERMERLLVDDRFSKNIVQITSSKHRSDLDYAAHVLADMTSRFPA